MAFVFVIVGVIVGWELRNIVSALIRKEKKRRRYEQFQRAVKKWNTFHQIEQLKIYEDSKEVLPNEILY